MWREVTGYAARMWRSLRRGHDPLRRHPDRLEGVLALGLILLAVALVPFSIWLGRSAGDGQAALAERQARDFRQVTAVTVAETTNRTVATDAMPVRVVTAAARWEAAGTTHRGQVPVPPDTRPGTEVPIWVDPSGARVGTPITAAAAATAGTVVGVFAWVSAMLLATCGFLAVRALLDAGRERRWTREISAFLGSATSH